MELKRYLRVVASTGDDDDDYSMVEISNHRAREAADRIEKLETALRVIVRVWDTDQPLSIAKAALARDAARKALDGKDGLP